jgi:hypothetical protein
VWGYIIQQFSQTVYILGAGFVLAAIVSKCGHLLGGEKHRLRVLENVVPRKVHIHQNVMCTPILKRFTKD